jgi:Zn finger protein HypA/HybF involved in hydrogenase expression
MHELAAVSALVDAVVNGIADRQPCRVDVVRVRRSTIFSDDALRQGFAMLTRGTALDGARLMIEVVERLIACPCGQTRSVTADDLVGHIWVCPACAHVEDIGDGDDLEVVNVTLTHRAGLSSGGSA